MIKGFITALMCMPFLCGVIYSQQLSHQVLVPVAGVSVSGGIGYSQTIGETAVEVIRNSDYSFTQGFQQPALRLKKEENGNDIRVFPNPVSDHVIIELIGESAKTFRIDFINVMGNTVLTKKISFSSRFHYREPQDLEDLARGFYLIRISSEDGLINRSFKIDKI